MIALKEFAERIQNTLNINPFGFNYAIFAEESEFKKAVKTRTEKTLFTNGLLRVGSSSIIPTQGIVVATQSALLELVVQLKDADTDGEIVAAHRAVLDKYAQQPIVDSMEEKDENGSIVATYTVTSLYSLASTGDVALRDGVGTSITFTVGIDFSYIQNGLNSSNCKFTLDGQPIPYSSAKITKTPLTQSDAFADTDGAANTINTSFVRSFDFQLPALKETPLGDVVIEQLLGTNLNTAHTLVVTLGNTTKTYSVVFGNTDVSLVGIDNAGHNISFVERRV